MTRRIAIGLGLATIALLVAVRAWPRRPLLDGASFSRAYFDRRGELLRLGLAPDEKYRLRTALPEISTRLVEATLLHEDRWFRLHPGVNPVTLVKGAWRTYVRGDRRVGGSTITMQLVRLRDGIDSRTLGGKLAQIGRALQLELLYSKDEILEAYLNLAPYGGNVEGVGAASLVYFGKRPDRLTPGEALTLALLPQDPSRRIVRTAPGSSLAVARQRLHERWRSSHPDADEELPPIQLRAPSDLPFLAPHFVDAVAATPRLGSVVETTLDLDSQRLLERHLHGFVERKRAIGIENAAALLVERRTLSVVAEVGSADFFDLAIEGQVSGTRARRSPGSTLKPFVYALALDQGLIHPRTMLADAPSSFGGYDPENADAEFAGPLPAQEALLRSRNVPAVALLARLKQPSLHGLLSRAGIGGLRTEAHYGLALILGGVEVTMEELVQLYAMLGSGGTFRRVHRVGATPAMLGVPGSSAPNERLLSPEASFATLAMLLENPPPAGSFSSGLGGSARSVAWKTGTSNGYRDGWTVGLLGPYVLAVWIGAFDGRSNPAFAGLPGAAPLFFEIAESLRARDRGLDPPWPAAPPEGLAQVGVCSVSGGLPGPHCPRVESTWFIPGISPAATCSIHRSVRVDPLTGARVCGDRQDARSEIHEYWPSDLLKVFRLAGVPRRAPPPDGPDCALADAAAHGVSPRITSPEAGLVYHVDPTRRSDEAVPLLATTDADAREVYWFANERLLGRGRAGEPFFWRPQPGRFVIRAVDDHGRASARPLTVKLSVAAARATNR